MKTFEIYKNIRKQAVIFGLSISLFALMMVATIASLLVIIFSFSFGVIIGVFIINAALYIVLTRINNNPQIFQMEKAFPEIISNKRNSGFDYEQD
jgi:Flp pilus assembly protein TadB